MFRQSIRRFGTTALRSSAETSYSVRVSSAQGVVNGLTEGKRGEKHQKAVHAIANFVSFLFAKQSATPPSSV
jgi:hypothetical protein